MSEIKKAIVYLKGKVAFVLEYEEVFFNEGRLSFNIKGSQVANLSSEYSYIISKESKIDTVKKLD